MPTNEQSRLARFVSAAAALLFLIVVSPEVAADRLAGGYWHNAVVKDDGSVWGWGWFSYGQVGAGAGWWRTPVQTLAPPEMVSVSTLEHHTLALTSSGTVWGWGLASSGQLGPGLGVSTDPVAIATDGLAVAAGQSHSVMLKGDGTVWSWGSNAFGQLGDGTTTDSALPVQAVGLSNVVAIAAGNKHTLAVTSDGHVWAWGINGSGQLGDGTTTNRLLPVEVQGLTAVVSISAGEHHSLALRSDGTVWSWGYNGHGQLGDGTWASRTVPVPTIGLSGVTAISAGWWHSLAVKSDGTAWSWGNNWYSQLGDGTGTNRNVPQAVPGLAGIASIAGARTHSLALTGDGQVWVWGLGGYGALGDGPDQTRPLPVALSEAGFVWKVATPGFNPLGGAYTAPRSVTLTCATAGAAIHYTTDGTEPDETSPVVASGSSVLLEATTVLKARAYRSGMPPSNVGLNVYTLRPLAPTADPPAGAFSTPPMVTLATGTAGAAIHYTIDGTDPTEASPLFQTPILISQSLTLRARAFKPGLAPSDPLMAAYTVAAPTLPLQPNARLAGGYWHVGVVDGEGTAWMWGWNAYRQLGDGTGAQRLQPTRLFVPTDLVALSTRQHHTLALSSGGTVWGWGQASSGQLGAGLGASTEPVAVATDALAVSAGQLHSVMLKSDGTVWSWGSNASGQLGDGTTTDSALPVRAVSLNEVTAIAAGNNHTLAVTSDGHVWAWGLNGSGQLGDGTTTTRLLPVEVQGLSGVVAVSAGEGYSLALKSDGTVWGWGYNGYGQLGDGTWTSRTTPVPAVGLSGVTAISAGWVHSLAVKSDGTVWAWGNNWYGQVGDGTTTSRSAPQIVEGLANVGSVGAGRVDSYALTLDGQVWAWGLGGYGELGDGSLEPRRRPVALSESGFVWKVATPRFNPLGGAYTAPQSVALSCLTGGASIHYTTDGSEPTESSPVVASGGSVLLEATTVLKVRAYRSDMPPSNLGEHTYMFNFGTLQAPVLTPAGGTHQSPLSVSMTGPLGADIRYTTDGSAPGPTSSLYAGPVTLEAGATVKAQSYRQDWTPSVVVSVDYVLQAAIPVASVPAGLYSHAIDVGLSSPTPVASIHYTLDGADPTEQDPVLAPGQTLAIDQDTTVAAIAAGPGLTPSAVARFGYTFGAAAPSFSMPGGIYQGGLTVALASATPGAVIHYTLDGSQAATDSPVYVAPLAISTSTTVRAVATLEPWGDSPEAAARYVIDGSAGQVQGGSGFAGAIDGSGGVYLWGANDHGQLGDGTTTPRSYPAIYAGPSNAYRLALGEGHGLALTRTGEVWSWGANTEGQLGDGTLVERGTPAPVLGLGPAVAMAAGARHSLAIDVAGHVWAWGDNAEGQLGDGTTETAASPTLVSGLGPVIAVAAGEEHSLAVDAAGRLWAWGANDDGQLGLGSYQSALVPTQVGSLTGVAAVAAGGAHSLALLGDGSVWAWGRNEFGQLGTGSWDWNSPNPYPVVLPEECGPDGCGTGSPLNEVRSVSARRGASVAVTLSGGLYVWGDTANGAYLRAATPVPFPTQVVEAAAGGTGVVARTEGDEVWAWGVNEWGEVGDWTNAASGVPVSIAAPGFAWRAGAPAFDPPPGAHSVSLSVALTSPTPGASVRYTIDGTDPGPGSAELPLGGTLQVDQATQVRARATAPGWAESNLSVGQYDFAVGPISLDPAPGDYDSPTSIIVTTSTADSELHYTTDGSEPNEQAPLIVSGSAIPLTSSFTLRVRAYKGSWQPAEAGGIYRLAAAAPAFSPAPGPYHTALDVVISCTTPGAVVRYTTDGSEPTPTSPTASPGLPVHIADALRLRAVAFHGSLEASAETAGDYVLTPPLPIALPAPGSYLEPQQVSLLSSVPGSVVRYEIGTAWVSATSPVFTAPILVEQGTVIRAAVFKDGWGPSDVADFSYEIAPPAVATPTFTPSHGTFATKQPVVVSTATAGAAIHYTVDGTEPDLTSPVVISGASVVVTRNTVLKARAWSSSGAEVSATRSGTFLITGAVSAGGNFTLGLAADGTVWSWGRNDEGQLGTGSGPWRSHPAQIAGLADIVAISAGGSHSLALKADGTVLAWGANSFGQVGDGGQSTRWVPVQVPGLSQIIAVSAGGAHSLALARSGQLYAWGRNTWGQVGDGSTSTRVSPVPVDRPYWMPPITAIAAGTGHSLAIAGAYSVWGWGLNGSGQLTGVPDQVPRRTPTQVAYLPLALEGPAVSISAGQDASLVLQSWGGPSGHLVALGARDPVFYDVSAISVNAAGNLAAKADGTLWQWPEDAGRLPARILGVDRAVSISSGASHSVALLPDGSLRTWGGNAYGELGDGSTVPSATPVEVLGLRLVDHGAGAGLDSDGDGLSDADEARYGCDRLNPDTNGDGIPDGDAVRLGLSPSNPDMDIDGLTNWEERARGTDPFRADTDGDGLQDGIDCRPLDPATTSCPSGDPSDTTPPSIVLWAPPGALLTQTLP